MILLSALLASLTGLVAGERPPVPAQVELSAGAFAARVEAIAAQASELALPVERGQAAPRQAPEACASILIVLAVGAFLSRKQSWLR